MLYKLIELETCRPYKIAEKLFKLPHTHMHTVNSRLIFFFFGLGHVCDIIRLSQFSAILTGKPAQKILCPSSPEKNRFYGFRFVFRQAKMASLRFYVFVYKTCVWQNKSLGRDSLNCHPVVVKKSFSLSSSQL